MGESLNGILIPILHTLLEVIQDGLKQLNLIPNYGPVETNIMLGLKCSVSSVIVCKLNMVMAKPIGLTMVSAVPLL